MDNKLSMENINLDINSTINEIISNEQNNEAIIKEKREVEDRMLVLNKSIKEMIAKTERGTQETIELATKSDQLRADLEIQKIQLQALKSQVEHAKELNKNIKQNIEYGIGDVWKLRSMLTNTTQKISEQCDVWSLMTRHVHQTSPPPLELKSETTEPILVNNDEKLKTAMERKQRALAERNWLRTEPEVSDDFVRIRNALRYFSEMNSTIRE